jgi:hypothetical protein
MRDVVPVLRASVRRSLKWPSRAQRTAIDEGSSGLVLEVELPSSALGEDFQTDTPAGPLFLLSTAWWLERALERRVRARVRIVGPPGEDQTMPHWQRAQPILHELSAPGERFEVEPTPNGVSVACCTTCA